MRRSFGPRMGGGGGGGAGGGGMLKSVHRAMRAGVGGNTPQESYSHVSTRTTGNRNNQQALNTTLSLSSNTSPPRSYLNHLLPEPHNWLTASPAAGEDYDWEYIDSGVSDADSAYGFYDDFVFGGVPTEQEVQHAVSSLQDVLEPISFGQLMKNRETMRTDEDDNDDAVEKISSPGSFRKSGSELDWSEPSMQLCYSTSVLQKDKVFDAFHLLQTEPSVQRMVTSLSSDPAVWGAIMNNEVVRELRESVREEKRNSDEHKGSNDDSNPVARVLCWIFANTKDKVNEIIEKITKVVNELLRPMIKDEKAKKVPNAGLDSFEEKLRNSFFLSILVLLIVVVSRSGKH